MTAHVVLIGPPGSGKSTVAALLAERIGADSHDTDTEVEHREQMTIGDLFVVKGEDYFREREHEAVASVLDEHDGVVALGGGAVVNDKTRSTLAPHRVVYLDVGLSAAVKRVGMNQQRPLLLGNVRAQMKQLMEQRRPLYREVADLVIDTDEVTAEQAGEQIAQWLEQT